MGRCMHLAVVRHSFSQSSKYYSTYKVYVNGCDDPCPFSILVADVARGPPCRQVLSKGEYPPCQAGGGCTGGRRPGIALKALSEGESNPVKLVKQE